MRFFSIGVVLSAIFASQNVSSQTICVTNNPYGMPDAQREACHRQQDREMMDKMRFEDNDRSRMLENDSKNQLTVESCTSNINIGSSPSDLDLAIDCLSNNRYAGQKHVENFINSSKEILNSFSGSEIKDNLWKKISELQKKKQPTYWMIINHANNSKEVLVADSYTFLPTVNKVYTKEVSYDLSAIPVYVTVVSKLFSDDEVIPFADFKSMTYFGSKNANSSVGTIRVNEKYEDDGYQEYSPFFIKTNDKPVALEFISGVAYGLNSGSFYKTGKKIEMRLSNLHKKTISLIDEKQAKEWIQQVGLNIKDQDNRREENEKKERLEKQAILTKLKSAKKGEEDSCQGDSYHDNQTFSCQFMDGKFYLSTIKESGWLVTNVSSIPGVVKKSVVISIKKVR